MNDEFKPYQIRVFPHWANFLESENLFIKYYSVFFSFSYLSCGDCS